MRPRRSGSRSGTTTRTRSEALRRRGFDRSFYPEGAARQLAAIYASGDRGRGAAPGSTVPTLVIHGRDDTLISPEGGMRTAELIPGGAACCCVADMGHDLPEPLWPVIVDAIAGHARTRGRPASDALSRWRHCTWPVH